MLDLQDAISLFEEGKPREAADLLEKLAAEMPGYATARVLLARSYEQLNDWEPALRAWREAHQIIPNSPVIRRGLQRAARKATSRAPTAAPQVSQAPSWEGVPDDAPPQAGTGETTDSGGAYEADVRTEPELSAPPEVRRKYEQEYRAEPESRADPKLHDVRKPTAEEDRDAAAEEVRDAAPAGGREETPDEIREEAPDEAREEEAREEITEKHPESRGREEYEDLDRLISELESARIVPRPDLENVPPPDLEDDIEDVVSETLARIYASQGQYDEAAHVYELLADQQPDKADEFKGKASEMRSRASEQE